MSQNEFENWIREAKLADLELNPNIVFCNGLVKPQEESIINENLQYLANITCSTKLVDKDANDLMRVKPYSDQVFEFKTYIN